MKQLLENGFKLDNTHLAGMEPRLNDTKTYRKGKLRVSVHPKNIHRYKGKHIVAFHENNCVAGGELVMTNSINDILLIDEGMNGKNFVETREFAYKPMTFDQLFGGMVTAFG